MFKINAKKAWGAEETVHWPSVCQATVRTWVRNFSTHIRNPSVAVHVCYRSVRETETGGFPGAYWPGSLANE